MDGSLLGLVIVVCILGLGLALTEARILRPNEGFAFTLFGFVIAMVVVLILMSFGCCEGIK
jgi:hypothetical protein